MTFADRLPRKSSLEHRARKPLDVRSRDAVHATLAESPRDVNTLHRLAVLSIRQTRPSTSKPSSQLVGDVIDGRRPLRGSWRRLPPLGLDEPSEAPSGIGASDAVLLAARSDLADLLVDEAAVDSTPAPVVGAVLEV
jgi:hypothetical protein